jgi:hypothetical protein
LNFFGGWLDISRVFFAVVFHYELKDTRLNTFGWQLCRCGLGELMFNTIFGGMCLVHTIGFVGVCNNNQIVGVFVRHTCNRED